MMPSWKIWPGTCGRDRRPCWFVSGRTMRNASSTCLTHILKRYCRLQESEADQLGLIFMAMAGYDPREAVDFWQRMDNQKGNGGTPPEFLSTHPSYETRIRDLRKHMTEALRYYIPIGNP